MRVEQVRITKSAEIAALAESDASVVLAFGDIGFFEDPSTFSSLRKAFPDSVLVGCSTAGEIFGRSVDSGSLVLTRLWFSAIEYRTSCARVAAMDDSFQAGSTIGADLSGFAPEAVLVFAPGVQVNGSALVQGIREHLPRTSISGGLAGDGGAFRRTFVLGPDGIESDKVVSLALRGTALRVTHGSFGGWTPFGPPREVTRATGNVLYELDGQPALALYKQYLGEYSSGLPASGLLFPFEMVDEGAPGNGLIRTILGVDESAGSLILAGDVRAGGQLRLMHASNERLVDGAESAARQAVDRWTEAKPELALLVSCVGRKLIMGDAIDDEVEAVAQVLGGEIPLCGFYSYGEIAPLGGQGECLLHNQTMTVTFLGER